MSRTAVLLAIFTACAMSANLYITDDPGDGLVVYRTPDHVVAFGEPAGNARVISSDASGLEGFALVTVRNENGVSQATELGEVVYRDHRTLIVNLERPLNGDFIRSGIFSVSPLREDRSPSEPIPIPFRGEYDDTVADIVAAVSEDTIIAYTTNYENYITRHSNSDGYDTACEWSNDKFLSFGLESEIRHFSMLSYDCQNVIATQTGTLYPDQYWIICGHLDSTSPIASTNAPGADDNGSGSSAVVEAARIMSEYQFEYTVRYCLWGGEEQGLYGSAHYADSVAAAGDQILGVVNLDMIYYGPPPDDQAELHYNTASQGLGLAFQSISDTYVPALGITVAGSPVSASDHASFWAVGYPAMLSIEKEVWNNPYYHQTTDIMANYLQYFPFGTDMTKAAIATVAYLAVPVSSGIEEGYTWCSGSTLNVEPVLNPSFGTASVAVEMPAGGPAVLDLYDAAGRRVNSADLDLQPGSSMVELETAGLPSGMYVVRITSDGASSSARMMLLR